MKNTNCLRHTCIQMLIASAAMMAAFGVQACQKGDLNCKVENTGKISLARTAEQQADAAARKAEIDEVARITFEAEKQQADAAARKAEIAERARIAAEAKKQQADAAARKAERAGIAAEATKKWVEAEKKKNSK